MTDDNKPMWRDYLVLDAEDRKVFGERRFNDLAVKGAGDGLRWDANSGAGPPYFVYCREEGEDGFGYIGTAEETTGFVNDRIAPDYRRSAPKRAADTMPLSGIPWSALPVDA